MCAQSAGIDAAEGIELANTDPTSNIHQPGIGVGGHCIPVYPYFFIDRFPTTRLLQVAREINDGMAEYGVGLLEAEIGSLADKRVVVLGLAFRANVKEATLSMTHLIVQALERRGAVALVHDPLFSPDEIAAYGYHPIDLDQDCLVDAVIVQAYHDQHRLLDMSRWTTCQAVLDGRNALPDEVIASLPCRYLSIGYRPRGVMRSRPEDLLDSSELVVSGT
jgi:nucleotide sugar dehydrogenase